MCWKRWERKKYCASNIDTNRSIILKFRKLVVEKSQRRIFFPFDKYSCLNVYDTYHLLQLHSFRLLLISLLLLAIEQVFLFCFVFLHLIVVIDAVYIGTVISWDNFPLFLFFLYSCMLTHSATIAPVLVAAQLSVMKVELISYICSAVC